MENTTIIANGVLIGVIIGLIQVAKATGLPTKYAPLASIVIGVIVFIVFSTDSMSQRILYGLVDGLIACGLYSGTKTTLVPQ